jgi:hypothetical protein
MEIRGRDFPPETLNGYGLCGFEEGSEEIKSRPVKE